MTVSVAVATKKIMIFISLFYMKLYVFNIYEMKYMVKHYYLK